MAHIALYRTWRSQTFREVVGQKPIIQTLQNSLREHRTTHAYLFSGPRGTGKTSTAKILAKAVNCERGPSEEPCNECSVCMRITEGAVMDVVEIDAASNRGVEEIRDIRDKVKYAPTEVRQKVYIIDEVHMLTTEAFNALLKTLEEPPAHAMFILATTEPHKLPATILSRCQRFDFRRVSLEEQVDRLQYVCEQEGLQIDEEAMHVIARLSDGGMRDALSLLDQAASFATGTITVQDVLMMTGGVASDQFELLLQKVASKDVGAVLEMIDVFMQEGKSADKCIENFMNYMRDLLLLRMIPTASAIKERIFRPERLQEVAEQFSASSLMWMIEVLARYQSEMKYSAQPQTMLELALMKLCAGSEAGEQRTAQADTSMHANKQSSHGSGSAQGNTAELIARVQRLEEQINLLQQAGSSAASGGGRAPASPVPTGSAIRATSASSGGARSRTQLQPYMAGSQSSDFTAIVSKWNHILTTVKERKITVHAWLVDGEPVSVTGESVLVGFKSAMHRDTTDKAVNKQLIEQVLSEVAGKPMKLVTVMISDWRAAQTKVEEKPEEMKLVPEAESGNEPEWVTEAIQLFGEDLVTVKDNE
jgi:DNA polymerase III subunit gamma/tau